jgi:hypothetical protein
MASLQRAKGEISVSIQAICMLLMQPAELGSSEWPITLKSGILCFRIMMHFGNKQATEIPRHLLQHFSPF